MKQHIFGAALMVGLVAGLAAQFGAATMGAQAGRTRDHDVVGVARIARTQGLGQAVQPQVEAIHLFSMVRVRSMSTMVKSAS